MKILMVALTMPFPPTNGHKMRTWSILRGLAAEGHQVSFLCFATRDEMAEDLRPFRAVCDSVKAIRCASQSLSATRHLFGRALAICRGMPYGVWRFRSKPMRAEVLRQIEIHRPDLLLAETSYSLVNLPRRLPVPLVVDHHNVEYLILKRYAEVETRALRRLYASREHAKMRVWDHQAIYRAELHLACSEPDREEMLRLRKESPCMVVPNTVDIEQYALAPSIPEPILLYVGGMDWYPNRDAAEFFARDIFPAIRERVKGARFVVAGRNPPAEITRRLSRLPGVELTGTVADMRKVIATAAVCVVPLRIGSGTRLKILEAAAMGKPVVATHLGAEGLAFVPGSEILLADAPGEFSRRVLELLNEEARRTEIGAAARRRVESSYSFSVLRQTLRCSMAALQKLPVNSQASGKSGVVRLETAS